MGKTYSRNRLLVYPKFQLSIIFVQVIIMMSVVGLVSYHAMKSYSDMHAMGLEANLPDGHPYFKFVEYHTHVFLKNLVFGSILGVLCSTLLSLVLSHRLAGPIIRLKSFFEALSRNEEELKPLKFRKYDFFTELAPVINRSVEVLMKKERNQK